MSDSSKQGQQSSRRPNDVKLRKDRLGEPHANRKVELMKTTVIVNEKSENAPKEGKNMSNKRVPNQEQRTSKKPPQNVPNGPEVTSKAKVIRRTELPDRQQEEKVTRHPKKMVKDVEICPEESRSPNFLPRKNNRHTNRAKPVEVPEEEEGIEVVEVEDGVTDVTEEEEDEQYDPFKNQTHCQKYFYCYALWFSILFIIGLGFFIVFLSLSIKKYGF